MEDKFTPTAWWRAIGPNGQVWCESSLESEVRDRKRPTDTLQRLYKKTESEWRDQK